MRFTAQGRNECGKEGVPLFGDAPHSRTADSPARSLCPIDRFDPIHHRGFPGRRKLSRYAFCFAGP